tara:strand:- start:59 stop:706 length:648 start_codon:yes stop_codon:yes gene_type:complete
MALTVLNKIGTASILDNAITSGKILDNAITSGKIIDNAITSGKIINNAVTSSKIVAGAAGKIRQTVSVLTTTQASQTVTTSDTQLGLLTKAITPLGANSKFLVYVRWFGEVNSSHNVCLNIQMNGTRVNINSGGRGYALAMPARTYDAVNDGSTPEPTNFQTLVSTSSVIGTAITFRAVVDSNDTKTLWNNRCYDTSGTDYERGTSELIITEVAG